MLHEASGPSGPDPAFAYKKRLGAWMFLAYSAVYTSFVLINLLSPRLMEIIVVAGVNLAVIYGYGLIVFAILLSLLYAALCNRRERFLSIRDRG